MRVLARSGRGPSSELSGLLEITPQGTAQIVDDMERRGYVVRRPSPDDARARLVELSGRGRAAIAAARAFHRSFETRMRRRHGTAAIETFRAVADRHGGRGPPGGTTASYAR